MESPTWFIHELLEVFIVISSQAEIYRELAINSSQKVYLNYDKQYHVLCVEEYNRMMQI